MSIQATEMGAPTREKVAKEIFTPQRAACSTTIIPARLPKIIRLLKNPVPSAKAAPIALTFVPGLKNGTSNITVGLFPIMLLKVALVKNRDKGLFKSIPYL